MERAALYTQGISNLMKHPVPSIATSVGGGAAAGYDMFVLEFADRHASANLNKDIASPLRVVIATPNVAIGGAFAGQFIQNFLDEYTASVPLGITGSAIV